jgi:1,4-alpha-glucan branching enzyme
MTTVLDDGSVEFRLFRPEAVCVRLAGTFSRWKPDVVMDGLSDGWWRKLLKLPPGEHRFRYEVDGRWFTDFAASAIEPDGFAFNSVVVVPRQAG